MQVSVVIPCHNAERYIGQALRSVADQTYKPHEVIVLDDDSSDGSIEAIRRSPLPVKLIRTTNHNAAATRNEGIEAATSDWIAFLDADDYWHPHHLAQSVAILRDSDDVASISPIDRLYHDGRVRKSYNRWPIHRPTTGLTHSQCIAFWRTDWLREPITVVARRERLLEIGGFDPTQRIAHDFDMWLRLIHNHTWAYIPEPGAVRRADVPGSVSRGNRVQASYFSIRAMLRNRPRYASRDFDVLLRRCVRVAVSKGLAAGDLGHVRRVLAMTEEHLSRPQRMLGRALLRAPNLYARPYHLYRWLRPLT